MRGRFMSLQQVQNSFPTYCLYRFNNNIKTEEGSEYPLNLKYSSRTSSTDTLEYLDSEIGEEFGKCIYIRGGYDQTHVILNASRNYNDYIEEFINLINGDFTLELFGKFYFNDDHYTILSIMIGVEPGDDKYNNNESSIRLMLGESGYIGSKYYYDLAELYARIGYIDENYGYMPRAIASPRNVRISESNYHFCLVKINTYLRFYIDGKIKYQLDLGTNKLYINENSKPDKLFSIYGLADSGHMLLDELIISRGAKYTSDFTPPSSPSTVIPKSWEYKRGF